MMRSSKDTSIARMSWGKELDEMLGSEEEYRKFGKPYAGGFIVRAVRTRYQMLARAKVLREKVGRQEQGEET